MLVLIYMVSLCLILHLMALHLSVRLTTISHSMVLASPPPHLFYCSIIVSEPEFIDLYERGDHYYFFMRETARETGDVSLRPVSCCSCCLSGWLL